MPDTATAWAFLKESDLIASAAEVQAGSVAAGGGVGVGPGPGGGTGATGGGGPHAAEQRRITSERRRMVRNIAAVPGGRLAFVHVLGSVHGRVRS